MTSQPFPTPEGMTKEKIDQMTVKEGEWRRSETYICRACCCPAYYHPYTNLIWGCRRCGFTTYSVAGFFVYRPQGTEVRGDAAVHHDEEFGDIKVSG